MSGGEITALLLTVDEPTTARARASVVQQTRPCADIVTVRGVVPFHRAVNAGVAQVRTPFFIQVDADMVLDPTCCADLFAAFGDHVGVVIGHLRDPLLGRVAGIKLFRRACFAEERFADSISPDTDFYNAIARRGWSTVYAIKPPATPHDPPHVFGAHAPDYTPRYTFNKFALLASRHRYRRAAVSLRQLLWGLHCSAHPAALLGLIGAAHGATRAGVNDQLEPFGDSGEWSRLESLLATRSVAPPAPTDLPDIAGLDVQAAWSRGYQRGRALYAARAGDAFVAAVHCLSAALGDTHGTPALVALSGLCHGVCAGELDDDAAIQAFVQLNQVLPSPYRLRHLPGAA